MRKLVVLAIVVLVVAAAVWFGGARLLDELRALHGGH